MSIYLFGPLIKQRREELGISQEELADGICSVPTLSRIENGERMPSKQHSEMLLQRLGYSDSIHISFVTEKTLELHNLKYKIRQALIHRRHEEAGALLEQFITEADRGDCVSEQFILLCQTILSQLPPEERLEQLTKAMRLTCPQYSPAAIPEFLSYEEILILNNIAICYGRSGQMDVAINIFSALKRYHENHMVNQEEILRTQLEILYNLSKYLGLAQRYDECIEICDLGIRISRETRKCSQLDKLLYNKAWSLLKRRQEQDEMIAKECLRKAICFSDAMNLAETKQYYLQFMRDHFTE